MSRDGLRYATLRNYATLRFVTDENYATKFRKLYGSAAGNLYSSRPHLRIKGIRSVHSDTRTVGVRGRLLAAGVTAGPRGTISSQPTVF